MQAFRAISGYLVVVIFMTLLTAHTVLADEFSAPDFWQHPAIAGFGAIHPLPKAAFQPDPRRTYKVVFDLQKASDEPSTPNPGLLRVATAVNVFASAGVPLKHLDFVVVISGEATKDVLDDGHYRVFTGVAENPNRQLIAALKKAGVRVTVCGQAMAHHRFSASWLNPDVILSLSAVSDVIILQQDGYALLRL